MLYDCTSGLILYGPSQSSTAAYRLTAATDCRAVGPVGRLYLITITATLNRGKGTQQLQRRE